jgi:glutamine---fructose-6-phosphate transaminase (isomerizing)
MALNTVFLQVLFTMCGIIGYKGTNPGKNVGHLLVNSLKRLEYRGYDSWGLVLRENPSLKVMKKVGRIGEFAESIDTNAKMGMAHTRWATHGGVTEDNAHPHLSCDGKIAVAHNGIIENYKEIKTRLTGKGHVFKSQTDTEVVPHLIEDYMNAGLNFKEATLASVRHFEGLYALTVMHKDHGQMIATRKGSPLVMGVGDGEFYIASDIPAFLEHTKNVVYLHDEDFVVLDDNQYEIYNLKLDAKVDRKMDSIAWDIQQAQKGDFEHFLLKEISEQTETIKKTTSQDKEAINHVASIINGASEVFLIGCGTALHACLAGDYFLSKIARKRATAHASYEFHNFSHFVSGNSVVIAVSQSGETVDTIEAVKIARERGAKVVSITNVVGSTLTRYSDYVINMNCGPEIAVVATKSYTSQLALMILLAYACAGKFDEGKNELEFAWNQLFNLTARSTRDHIRDLADKLRFCQHLFTIGRGLEYPSALEAALKIKEVSYIHAEGFAGGGLKHGPLALITNGTPCMVFVSKDNEKQILSNAEEIRARGGYIIGVGAEKHDVFDFFIKVPEAGHATPILHAIPAQVLAYQLAVLRGNDPDKPRNLAKSVTVK